MSGRMNNIPVSRRKGMKNLRTCMTNSKSAWNSSKKEKTIIDKLSLGEIEIEYNKIKNKESKLSSAERKYICEFVESFK